MKNYIFLLLTSSFLLGSCISDDIIEDFVEPTLRLTTLPDSIELNTTFQFEFMYLNNIGLEENVDATWTSSDESIIEIDADGLALAKGAGSANISVAYKDNEVDLSASKLVFVGSSTVEQSEEKTGSIQTTSSYALEGDFTLIQDGDNLFLEFEDNYKASSALPGLFLYLSNNKNSIANAIEIAAVETFSGSHSYDIEDVGINDYKFLLYFCKPFNVKVGDGEIN